MPKWETTEYDLLDDGSPRPSLTTQFNEVTVTMTMHDDHDCLMWSVNLRGARLPTVEDVAEQVARRIQTYIEQLGGEPYGG